MTCLVILKKSLVCCTPCQNCGSGNLYGKSCELQDSAWDQIKSKTCSLATRSLHIGERVIYWEWLAFQHEVFKWKISFLFQIIWKVPWIGKKILGPPEPPHFLNPGSAPGYCKIILWLGVCKNSSVNWLHHIYNLKLSNILALYAISVKVPGV